MIACSTHFLIKHCHERMSRLLSFRPYWSLKIARAIPLTRASVSLVVAQARTSSFCSVPRLEIRSHQPVPTPVFRWHSTSTSTVADNHHTVQLSLRLEQDGLLLNLSWRDGEDAKHVTSLYGVWLRHNCQCSECIVGNEILISPESLDPAITVQSVNISGNQLKLVWSSGHHGHIDIDWLRKKTSVDTASNSVPPLATEVPRLSSVGLEDDEEQQWKWLYNVNEYGVCILTDFGTRRDDVKKLAKLTYNVMPNVYGDTYDLIAKEQAVDQANNTMGMNMHMDLDVYESPAGLQFMHCIQFDQCVVGGDSFFLDAVHIAEEMRSKFPKHFDTLTRVPATNHRSHYDRNDVKPLDMTYYAPHISVDKNGKVTSFRWSPQCTRSPVVPNEDILPYYEAFKCLTSLIYDSKAKIKFRLKPGEVLTFNNRRMLHTRGEIHLNGGARCIQGTYANIDEFQSKFRVLCKKLGKEDHLIRRFFNGSAININ